MPRIRVPRAEPPQLELFAPRAEPAAVTALLQPATEPVAPRMVRVKKPPAVVAPAVELEPARAAPVNVVAATEPWSYFTKSHHLSADEATRAVRGQTLGYVGVRFHKSGAVLCRSCHEAMIQGTQRFSPAGFEGQGYQATVYSCEQRKPNVTARCGVCSNDVIGEVAGG